MVVHSLATMAYRTTERALARRLAVRERILRAAHALVARGGFGAAQVAAVAAQAGVATGTVYRYFASQARLPAGPFSRAFAPKPALFPEVFRRAAQHEVDAVIAAATLSEGVETFARRAL